MRFSKRIDPLHKFFIFAGTYLLIVVAVTALLHHSILSMSNPGEINTKIGLLYRDKIVQHGLEQNITRIYIEDIPITTDYDNPYSKNATMNTGYVLRFEPGTSDDEIKVIAETYDRMYHYEIMLRIKILLVVASLVWLLPCILLYGIGWKSRWWVNSGGKVEDIESTSVRGRRTRRGRWKRSTSFYDVGE